MKTKIIATALLGATAVAVGFAPLVQGTATTRPSDPVVTTNPIAVPSVDPIDAQIRSRKQIEVVFALDTTGSMGGLIEAAKEKIWSIATTMASANDAPVVKMGLVAFRDRGDAYVTRVVDLTEDLDSMYATLMDFRAGGGGDGPESVNEALHEAVAGMSWSQSQDVYKVVFLVGDAPPHMDYPDDVKYPATLALAKDRGIVVNAIQCGANQWTTRAWQHVAMLGAGEFFQVGQNGSAVAISTPFDEKLAKLSSELDSTRLYYGTAEERAKKQTKIDATTKLREEASVGSQARRATFNASKSGEANLAGDGDLVADVASGRVEAAALPASVLPAPMHDMAPAEREAHVRQTAERRDALKREIQSLADERAAYIAKEIDARGGAKDSLDDKIYGAVRAQAESKGLSYESAAPRY